MGQLNKQMISVNNLDDFKATKAELDNTLEKLDKLNNDSKNLYTSAGKNTDNNTQTLNKDKLTAKLIKMFGQMRELNLNQEQADKTDSLDNNFELTEKTEGRQPKQLKKMASRLNDLGSLLAEADLSQDKLPPDNDTPDNDRLNKRDKQRDKKRMSDQLSDFKTEKNERKNKLKDRQLPDKKKFMEIKGQKAVDRLDKSLKRLEAQQAQLEQQDKKDDSSKKQMRSNKGGGQMSKQSEKSAKTSRSSKNKFKKTNVAKQSDVIPDSKTINNAYPMEEELYQQEALARIIKRIENQKKLIKEIYHKESKTQVTDYKAERRTGTFTQPEGINIDRAALTTAEPKKTLKKIKILKPKETASGKSAAYGQQVIKLETGFVNLSIKPEDLGDIRQKDIPLDKTRPQYKVERGLKLNDYQQMDKALENQTIPHEYKNIIGKIFISGEQGVK